jgi:hypothetical protein
MSQAGHQRRSFRGGSHARILVVQAGPSELPQIRMLQSSFTRVGLLDLQASEGMWVCKSEIFINFDFTVLTGGVGSAEPHTFGER